MNILILTNHFNPGGISSYILSLARGLKARGHKVCVASGGGEWLGRLRDYGIEHLYLPLNTKSIISPKLLLAYRILARILSEKDIDVMHAQTRVSGFLACRVSHRSAVPVVSTAHGFFRRRLGRYIFSSWGEKVIAISEPVRQHLLKDFKLSDSDVRLVANGIDVGSGQPADPQSRKKARESFGLGDGPVIGIIARLSEVKGHRYLIKAMKIVIGHIPDAQLLIIGDGKIKAGLENLAENLGIRKRVYFVASVPDTAKAFCAMDIFAMPSLQEGLGLSIMEAMLYGVPVVASGVGGIISLIKNEETGILVEPARPEALSAAVIGLLEDKDRLLRLSVNARNLIIRDFSFQKMAEATEGVYKECTKRP